MKKTTLSKAILLSRLLPLVMGAMIMMPAGAAHAAVPGITGPTFNLIAQPGYISQPDGASIYSWGYGCNGDPTGFAPAGMVNANCPSMQTPGPTLIVHEEDTVTINLTNNLPPAAGNTSILFPGFNVAATGTGIVDGLLTKEAPPGVTITYTFTANTPGTRAYYSGTQSDLQIEMGLYGAIIVLPQTSAICQPGPKSQSSFRLATSAYDDISGTNSTCYDREYMFQFSAIDPDIHRQAEEQAGKTCPAGSAAGCMNVVMEPYLPAYYLINGRSMPDDMDPPYAPQYPSQPYNANPHIHPGELMLVRIVGHDRWQHPFHEHAEHLRVLARDGNLLTAEGDPTKLAGPLLYTTTTVPGQATDNIFYWTGKGLNWDVFGHKPGDGSVCAPDESGYYTSDPSAPNYYEWCQDHNKPLEKHPFGNVGSGGPVTLPDATILANGPWFGGSAYLGAPATVRAVGFTGTTPPSGTVVNPPSVEAGFGYMWHSHSERELTTNNIFPGGMLVIMLVDAYTFDIDETK